MERSGLLHEWPEEAFKGQSEAITDLCLTSPLPHQTEAIRAFLAGKVLCGDEMGLGKSRTTLGYYTHLLFHGEIDWLVVLCPKRVMSVWHDEMQKHLGYIPEKATVLNYDRIWRHPWQEELQKLLTHERCLLVLDECHNLSRMESRRTEAAWRLCRMATRVLGLSGSPVRRGPESFFNVYRVITGASCTDRQFRLLFVQEWRKKRIYHDLEDLEEIYRRVGIRRRKVDVKELPPRTITPVYVELEGRQKKLYEEMRQEALVTLQGMDEETFRVRAREVLSLCTRLLQLTTHPGLLGDSISDEHISRIRALDELLVESGEEKVVVWSKHPWILEKLAKRYADRNPVVVHGQKTDHQNEEALRRFREDPDCLLLLANMLAFAEGLNLQVSTVGIYYDLTYRFDRWAHSLERQHRIDSTRAVQIYVLLARNTIDELVLQNLLKKTEWQQTVTGVAELTLQDLISCMSGKTGCHSDSVRSIW